MFLQVPAAETAESKGGPGILSQVLSELTAPFYEEDEADFDSEDSSSVDPSLEDTSKEEGNNKNIHQDYPSSSENKEEEDKKEDNEDIASKHLSSVILSELTAPFYEENEADFDLEDSSSVDPSLEDTSKEEGNNKNIHQDYPSSSENKEEEDKKEENKDIASKHPSPEESSDKGNKDDNDDNIPSVDSISEKNLRKEDKNKENVSPHTSSENKLDNYDHQSSLEENVDKSDSSSREITSDVAIRDEDDKKINEEPQFASSKYMSVSRDSCAFIQSCFPLGGEQKKRNIFFSHTSGSLGASVCVGGEGRGGD